MFNPEKLLGGLIKGSLGGGRGSRTKSAIGLGLLGVAMEAYEHYSNQQRPAQPGAMPPAPSPPPLPGSSGRNLGPSMPPPLPSATPPPLPTSPSLAPPPPASSASSEAVLLIRSMIVAAYADGRLDESERGRILERLEPVGLDEEERQFIVAELNAPASLDAVVAAANTPALAQRVYAASVLAIEVDTDQERAYLNTLAKRLSLGEDVTRRIHRELGVVVP